MTTKTKNRALIVFLSIVFVLTLILCVIMAKSVKAETPVITMKESASCLICKNGMEPWIICQETHSQIKQRTHFSASLARYKHLTKFWCIKCKLLCGNFWETAQKKRKDWPMPWAPSHLISWWLERGRNVGVWAAMLGQEWYVRTKDGRAADARGLDLWLSLDFFTWKKKKLSS